PHVSRVTLVGEYRAQQFFERLSTVQPAQQPLPTAEIGRMVDNIEHLVPAIECAFFHPIAQFAPCLAPVGYFVEAIQQVDITAYIHHQDLGSNASQTSIPAERTIGRSKADNQYLLDIGTVVGIDLPQYIDYSPQRNNVVSVIAT